MNEIQQSVETVVNSITQLGIDMGIPFDVVPKLVKVDVLSHSLHFSIKLIICDVTSIKSSPTHYATSYNNG